MVLKAPYIELLYSAVDDDIIPELKRLVCAALAAREQFRKSKPPWAPELPISFDACEKLQNSASQRMRQLGKFAYSLLVSQYDPAHPSFSEWLAQRGRRPDDESLERFERFLRRIDAGIMHRGVVPASL
jgi:hypothetical protein